MINLPFKSLWNYQYQKNENSSINKYNLIFKSYTMIAEVMKKVLETYINDLKASQNTLTGFDEGLFYALMDRVKVNKNEIKIIWKDGTES